jgi:hypothetical protein
MKEDPMTTDGPKAAKSKISRTRKAAASRAGGLVASARDLAGQVEAVTGTARDAYRSVETMPKSQQKTLTRASLGIGAALVILGAPRLLTMLAFLPAIVVAGLRLMRHTA